MSRGSDHHSTVVRVRAGLQALRIGIPAGYPDYVLHKMVTVMKGGEEVKISKRAGSYVTVRDLIDEVGRDAVRFFLVSRKADTEFIFDIDLAKSQSEDNPVYYVQYAHARICSVLDAMARGRFPDEPAAHAAGRAGSARRAARTRAAAAPRRLPGRAGRAAADELAPHLVAFYLRELAGEFHSYYNAERVLVPETRHAAGATGAARRPCGRCCKWPRRPRRERS